MKHRQLIYEIFGTDSEDESSESANQANFVPGISRDDLEVAAVCKHHIGNFDDCEPSEVKDGDTLCHERNRDGLKGKAALEPKLKAKATESAHVSEHSSRPPFSPREQLNLFEASNVVGIERKPFDPNAELPPSRAPPGNIIRWREVTNPDGSTSVESNARIVEWSDNSLQLFIGNEAYNITMQDLQNQEVFLNPKEGLYQAQGRLEKKMVVTPSSVDSDAHRRVATLVKSREKEKAKVKPYVGEVDPETFVIPKEKKERTRNNSFQSRYISSTSKAVLPFNYSNKRSSSRDNTSSTAMVPFKPTQSSSSSHNDSSSKDLVPYETSSSRGKSRSKAPVSFKRLRDLSP